MMIRAITLSGEAASGKSSLAQALMAALPGWRRTNTGQKVRECFAAILKIYCYSPEDIRVQRYQRREHVPTAQATADLQTRDQQDVEHFHHLYGIADYRSPAFYDLRIDTSQGTPAQLASLIIAQMG